MTTLYCTTDGFAIYSTGTTAEAALADLREQGGIADEIRWGYERDARLSLIGITPDLYEIVERDGGNISFAIDGYGRRAVAVAVPLRHVVTGFQIQIQRGGPKTGYWWETVRSLALPRNGFATEAEASAYISHHMPHVTVPTRVVEVACDA